MVSIRLFVSVIADGGEFFVTFFTDSQMPFPPVAGMRIGTHPNSDFTTDSDEVSLVMWNTSTQLYHVELASIRLGSDDDARRTSKCLIEEGWKVHLGEEFGTEDLARRVAAEIGADSGDRIIACRSGYYLDRASVAWALSQSRESFTASPLQ